MNLTRIRHHLRLGAALLASVVALDAAVAQVGTSTFAEDSGSALNRYLKELADNPRSLSALLGAAKAALDLGDPQAAVTFYARAEEVAPRDGRVKAGIAAAFLAMEQPAPALRFLEEARGLGLPEGAIAADRGLAFDLLGDPQAAQRDYALAMRANDGDELRRRLALSRAISGDRGGALSAIEDQVRRGSPAGRRVRAFVLALTGDANGATEAARVAMPAQASALQPFFARLPSLRPAERAMAVHFGRFPGDSPPGPAPITTPTYAALSPLVTASGRPDQNQPSLSPRRPAAPALSPPASAGPETREPARVSRPVSNSPSPPVFGTQPNPSPVAGARLQAPVQGPPDGGVRPSAAGSYASTSAPSASGRSGAPTPGISAIDLPVANPNPPIATAGSAPPPAVERAPSESARPIGLASVAATIRSLSDGADRVSADRATPPAATRPELPMQSPTIALPVAPSLPTPTPSPPANTTASQAEPVVLAKRTEVPLPAARAETSAKPPPPRRFWVQLGGKPDEASLKVEFQRLKGKAPELLGDKAAWAAPASATTSRLLVGPFRTRDDADLFVELLGEEGLRATAWTSTAGQEIAKLASK